MNSLPQDIYDEIGSLLLNTAFDRPALATVSRQWQAAIERQTFKNLHLKSTELDRFQNIVRDYRRRYVNTINYVVILPVYRDEERNRFEREADRYANDEVFTTAMSRLFHLLRSWDVHKDGYIELVLKDVYSDSDHVFLRRSSPFAREHSHLRMDGHTRDIIDLQSWRFRYSYLRLLYASELPAVPVVRSLANLTTTRNICDRAFIDMAARLPNLHSGSWMMNDWEIRYITLRRAHRYDLAQAIAEALPKSVALESLSLSMASPFYWTPKFSAGSLNLSNSGSSIDALSNAIHTATTSLIRLKDLRIWGTIDESLFWPGPSHALSQPYWQNLERLHIHFCARRPSGGFYFRGSDLSTIEAHYEEVPPGYNDDLGIDTAADFVIQDHIHLPPREHAITVDDDSLVPLLEAFGRACLQMPMIKSAQLKTTVPVPIVSATSTVSGNRDRRTWGVWYLSPGTSSINLALNKYVQKRRLFWNVEDWRPSMDLGVIFRDIGRERHGLHLVEEFLDSWEKKHII